MVQSDNMGDSDRGDAWRSKPGKLWPVEPGLWELRSSPAKLWPTKPLSFDWLWIHVRKRSEKSVALAVQSHHSTNVLLS